MISVVGRSVARRLPGHVARTVPAGIASRRPLSSSGASDSQLLSDEQVEEFHSKGYTHIPQLLTEDEILPLEAVYQRFLNREIEVPGKDFCDMSQGFDVGFDDFRIVNCMLPRVYCPELQGNLYEQRATEVIRQLFPDVEMAIDYDQLLDKRPQETEAVFAPHQDMAYWPPPSVIGGDTRTATFSLAFDSTTMENGCLYFLPGSHLEPELRPHVPIGDTREEAHAIAVDVPQEDWARMEYLPIPRGGITIHNERILHGSHGNKSTGHRRTYVLAFRTADTVKRERALGFTHSHNDEVNWDSFHEHLANRQA